MKEQLIETIAVCKQAAWVENLEAVVYTTAGKNELQKILGEAGIVSRFADENMKAQWPNGMAVRVIHYLVTDDEFCQLTGRTKREIALRDDSGAIVKPPSLVEQMVLARSESDTEALIVFHQQLASMLPAEQAEVALAALAPITQGPATAFVIDHYVHNFADIIELMPDPTEALATIPPWTIMMLLRDEDGNPGSNRIAESAWPILPYIPIQGFRQELRGKNARVQSKLARTLIRSFTEWHEVVPAIRSQITDLREQAVREAEIKLCRLLHFIGEDILSIERDCVPQELRDYFVELYQETNGVLPWENDNGR